MWIKGLKEDHWFRTCYNCGNPGLFYIRVMFEQGPRDFSVCCFRNFECMTKEREKSLYEKTIRLIKNNVIKRIDL